MKTAILGLSLLVSTISFGAETCGKVAITAQAPYLDLTNRSGALCIAGRIDLGDGVAPSSIVGTKVKEIICENEKFIVVQTSELSNTRLILVKASSTF